MIAVQDLNITVMRSGAIEVSVMVHSYRKSTTYYFCTQEEAIESFLEEVNA